MFGDDDGASPRYLFNGKELDEETGLYYYGARYYDGKTSVWLSVDPLAEEPEQEGKSPYAWNNPIRYNDPDGRCPNCVTAAIGAGIGALIGGGLELGAQLYRGEDVNWRKVGGSALQGAVTGGAAGFTGGASLLVTAGVSATANVVGGALNKTINNEEITASSVLIDATVGAVFGAGGKLIGSGLNSLSSQISKQATSKLTEAAKSVLRSMGKGSGPVYGTKAHSAFAKLVNGMKVGDNVIKTEVSYLNGQIVKHGTKESARIDAGLFDAKGGFYRYLT